MEILQFKKVTQDIETQPFDCGVESINEYVKNSYYPTIVQHAYAYSIMSHDKVLGYYQIMFREIELQDFPDDIADYDAGVKDGRISAVHIRYIAISEQYQKNKIGTSTLRAVIKNVIDLSDIWPIRVITIDARPDLVEWYQKEGFVKMQNNTIGQNGTTEAMYFDCLRYPDELEHYLEDNI